MSEPPSIANASVGLMSTTLVTPPLTGTVTLVHEVPLKCSSTGAVFRRSTPSVDAVPAAQMSDGDDPELEVMSRPQRHAGRDGHLRPRGAVEVERDGLGDVGGADVDDGAAFGGDVVADVPAIELTPHWLLASVHSPAGSPCPSSWS